MTDTIVRVVAVEGGQVWVIQRPRDAGGPPVALYVSSGALRLTVQQCKRVEFLLARARLRMLHRVPDDRSNELSGTLEPD